MPREESGESRLEKLVVLKVDIASRIGEISAALSATRVAEIEHTLPRQGTFIHIEEKVRAPTPSPF